MARKVVINELKEKAKGCIEEKLLRCIHCHHYLCRKSKMTGVGLTVAGTDDLVAYNCHWCGMFNARYLDGLRKLVFFELMRTQCSGK